MPPSYQAGEVLMWTMTPYPELDAMTMAQQQYQKLSIFPRLVDEELERAVGDPDVDIETVVALAEKRAQWD